MTVSKYPPLPEAGPYKTWTPCPEDKIDIHVILTLQKTVYGPCTIGSINLGPGTRAEMSEHRASVFRLDRPASRAEILDRMLEAFPEHLRDGVILAFTAEPVLIGDRS